MNPRPLFLALRLFLVLGPSRRQRIAGWLLLAYVLGTGVGMRFGPAYGAIAAWAIASCAYPVRRELCTAPVTSFSDNGLIFGTQAITTVTGAVTYIAEDINVTAGSKRLETQGVSGVPNRQAWMDEVPNGTATLQLASSATVPPARYDTFPLTPVGGGTALVFIITEVGQKFEVQGETKLSIKFYLSLSTEGQVA